MARSLLIVLLMTTQLLTGSGGTIYLCIHADGSFCSLLPHPNACDCRQDLQDPVSDHACAHDCGHDHDDSHRDAPVNEPPQVADACVMQPDGCGCTQFPVSVSTDQSLSTAWESAAIYAQAVSLRHVASALMFPALRQWESERDSRHPEAPSAPPLYTAAVMATVVIRC